MSEMTENGTKRYKLKEVCIRLAEGHPLYSDVPLSSPTAALDVMRKELSQYDREVLCVVNLNNKLKPINFNIVSMGSINGSIASIPNILKSGILSNAYGFLLLHNHPSGDVTPSREDIQTTRRCIEAGKIMDIPCLDHVIVDGGNSDYYSFRESGMVDFTNEKISMTAEQILRVNETNSTYKGGTETMPENGRQDDLFVPDFVKEAEEQIAKGVKLPTQEEVTIKFGKGLAEPFQSKDGREFMRITIPNQDPADKTPQDDKGKNIWQDVKTQVPNRDLKTMVEAYKTKAPQEKSAQPRESAREKLDALVKDTAAKVSIDKPKAKTKSKKGPEL